MVVASPPPLIQRSSKESQAAIYLHNKEGMRKIGTRIFCSLTKSADFFFSFFWHPWLTIQQTFVAYLPTSVNTVLLLFVADAHLITCGTKQSTHFCCCPRFFSDNPLRDRHQKRGEGTLVTHLPLESSFFLQ